MACFSEEMVHRELHTKTLSKLTGLAIENRHHHSV